MRRSLSVPVLGLLLAAAACVAPPAPEPAPPPPQPVRPTPPPRPAPLPVDWMDWPLTAGDWRYSQDARGSIASYGRIGAPVDFEVRCQRGHRRITLARPGVLDPGKSAQMALRTTASAARYSVANLPGTPAFVGAGLSAVDPFLDHIAFSRGRFLVQTEGAQDLVLPNWAELARVVEDCRG